MLCYILAPQYLPYQKYPSFFSVFPDSVQVSTLWWLPSQASPKFRCSHNTLRLFLPEHVSHYIVTVSWSVSCSNEFPKHRGPSYSSLCSQRLAQCATHRRNPMKVCRINEAQPGQELPTAYLRLLPKHSSSGSLTNRQAISLLTVGGNFSYEVLVSSRLSCFPYS